MNSTDKNLPAADNRFLTALCSSFFLILPLIYFPALFDPAQISRAFVAYSLVIIAFIFLPLRFSGYRIAVGLFDLFWILYILFSSIACFTARDRSIAFFELSKLFLFYFLFVLFRFAVTHNAAVLKQVSFFVACNCIFQFIVVVAQKLWNWDMFGSRADFFGTMTHANILAESMLFSLPFATYAVMTRHGKSRYIPVIGICCSLLLIFVLKSRAVWVSLIAASVFVLIVMLTTGTMSALKKWLSDHHRPLIAATIAIMICAAILFLLDVHDFLDHIRSLIVLDSNNRTWLWSRTFPVIKDHLLTGVGLGNWRFYIPTLMDSELPKIVSFQRPHNDFLWVLSEGGIGALLFYLAVMFAVIFKMTKNLRSMQPENQLLHNMVLFGLISFLSVSFFAFPKERILHLIFFALFCALPYTVNPDRIILSINVRILASAFIIISLISLWFNFQRMQGEMAVKRVEFDIALSSRSKIELLHNVNPIFYAVDPVSMPVKFYEGIAWLESGNPKKMIDCLLEAHAVYPLQPEVLLNLGTGYEQLGDRGLARKYYREAIDADSLHLRAKINLAIIELRDGNKQESAAVLETIDTISLEQAPQLKAQYQTLKNSLRKWL